MTKRMTSFILMGAAACSLACFLGGFAWFRGRRAEEGFYQGKSAGEWIKQLKNDEPLPTNMLAPAGGLTTRKEVGGVDEAHDALVKIGRPALPALTQTLEESDPGTRVNAAWALWQITGDTSTSVPVLLAGLTDNIAYQRDRWVRYDAINALMEIARKDSPAVLPQLNAMLNDVDEAHAKAAAQVLGRAGQR